MVKKKIIVFCVGSCYKAYHEWLEENYEIVALVDNDKTKWGKTYYGHQCGSLEIALSMRPEQVIIATTNRSIANAVLAQVKKATPDMDVIVIGKIADYNVVLKNSEHKKYYIDKLDNKIIFDGNATFAKMNFIFEGKNNKVRIGDGVRADFMHVFFSGNDNCLEIGEKTTIGSVQMLLAENGKIMIGNDCMLSTEIEIFQSASHPIFDLQTGVRLNYSRNVRIGNHVWVGRRSALMSGFSIGDGSVVGFGSVTSGQFRENVIIAGSPARVIRKDVRWERDSLLYKLDHVSDCLRGAEVTAW